MVYIYDDQKVEFSCCFCLEVCFYDTRRKIWQGALCGRKCALSLFDSGSQEKWGRLQVNNSIELGHDKEIVWSNIDSAVSLM